MSGKRVLFVVTSGLLLSAATVNGIFIDNASHASTCRSLTAVELWNCFGGDPVTHHLCQAISGCNQQETLCSDYTGGSGIICRTKRENVKIELLNDEGCTPTGNPADMCEESPNYDEVCFQRWLCMFDVEEGCMRDEGDYGGTNPNQWQAPEECVTPEP